MLDVVVVADVDRQRMAAAEERAVETVRVVARHRGDADECQQCGESHRCRARNQVL